MRSTTPRLSPLWGMSTFLALCALLGFWYFQGRPVALPDATLPGQRLQCASYSPFGKDQSPFDQPLAIRQSQLDSDLAVLSTRFSCLRTYSMTGLETLPELARAHGLKLMLGAWVNSDPADTQKELDALVAAANAYPDVVQAVIVGNEVLLRKEATGERMAALVRQVKARVHQPVTYADVWEYWTLYPQVAPEVDFITVHLLPYWEDVPYGVGTALAHVQAIHDDFARRFAPKPVMIGETGWPSQGRRRETAEPGPVNQARFVRGFVHLADRLGWQYNLIEAIDQPWKRNNEGAVGGYWGMFDADRQDKGVLFGPISNLPGWRGWLAGSALLTLALLAVAGRPRSRRAGLALPWISAAAAASLACWARQTSVDARYLGEWAWALGLGALSLAMLADAVLQLGSLAGWRQRALGMLGRYRRPLALAAGFAMAVEVLWMVFDPRYRNFATAGLLIPVLCLVWRPVQLPRPSARLLAAVCAAGVPLQLLREGWQNPYAWAWAVLSGAMAYGLYKPGRMPAGASIQGR
ncbi:beta (1-6) glucans synthase [Pseudomonas sp. RIT-PI-S]|uniref:glycoside hydrolase family 17 protein n=1 Tax=Pseudomonas sp. RIT-PI-S TaxID=3035295 RepID=UPI0021DA0161|nr:beta (1-6) glucans synthase [Pseudomonas sp. RIT-PI-S]